MAGQKGELEGKIALVTGSSRGIGAACAAMMAREGADVVVNYLHSKDEAEGVAASVRDKGRRALVIQADVSSEQQVTEMVERANQAWGRIDILVNNAARHPTNVRTIEDMNLEDWYATLDTNLTSQILCLRAVVPGMMERGWGRIVNVSSLVAQRGTLSGNPFYVTSKAGVHGLTLAVFRKLAARGITVNTVSPGTIDTEMTRELLTPEQMQARAKDVPVGRLGRSEEVAEVICFLTSERASFVTGQLVMVNGGQVV